MRYGVLIILLLIGLEGHSQTAPGYQLENESVIYSFRTKNGKVMSLCMDTAEAYIVYRFGGRNKVELEFPEKNVESWKKMCYSYYFRGGGFENSGLDLNEAFFEKDGDEYVVFENYSSEDESFETGIKVIEIKSGKQTEMPADPDSRKGSLIDLRFNELIRRGDKLHE